MDIRRFAVSSSTGVVVRGQREAAAEAKHLRRAQRERRASVSSASVLAGVVSVFRGEWFD